MEKYFKTKEYGVYALASLTPDNIKSAYKKGDIKRNRYLNLVAKTLGFQDWSVYSREYEEKLLPFMQKKGLHPAKQLQPEDTFMPSSYINFSLRAIADRVFLSQKELPKRIFTAYRCKVDDYGYYDAQNIFGYQLLAGKKRDLTYEYVSDLMQRQDYINYKEEQELDFLIPMQTHEFSPFVNLIGDMFVENRDDDADEYLCQVYEKGVGTVEQSEYIKIAKLLKGELLECEKGWLEIIPFNDSLVFLKAYDGRWDFIFKNLRDERFISPYYKYITHDNLPSAFNEMYDFKRWLYFGHKGHIENVKEISVFEMWLERDEHLAEDMFYKKYLTREYPSPLKVLQEYYKERGQYRYDNKVSHKLLDGFSCVNLGDKTLAISSLVTFDEFVTFLQKSDYKQSRSKHLNNLDIEDRTNGDVISVIWYDALSYCRYIEITEGVACRLLTKEEFDEIESLGISLEGIQDAKFFEWSGSFRERAEDGGGAFAISQYRKWCNKYLGASLNYKYKNTQTGFRVCYEYSKK